MFGLQHPNHYIVYFNLITLGQFSISSKQNILLDFTIRPHQIDH